MKILLLNILFLSSLSAFASSADCDDETTKALKPVLDVVEEVKEKECPNNKDLDSICMFVASRTADTKPLAKKYPYLYQRVIFEASCVDVNKHSDAEIQQKVQKMWSTFEGELTCRNTQFSVTDGNLLKFGASRTFDRFIYDILKWKVNLNRIDPSDNRTVLDYIQEQIERNKGNSTLKKYESYYRRLKAAGAKHRAEL